MPPPGWLTIEQLEKIEREKEEASIAEFEESVSHFLPQAAQKAQELVTAINDRFNIRIPVSYLTIENSTTFHVVMLVGQEDFLSPEMVAARILAQRSNMRNEDFDMHYTFTVDIQYLAKNSLQPNSYKLKHIPDFEKNLQIELVYLQSA